MTTAQLHILRHSLGLDDAGNPRHGTTGYYRNRYVVGPGQSGFDDCRELVTLGLMKDHGAQSMTGGMHCFEVTDAGKEKVLEHNPVAKKLTRGQQRYRDFLNFDGGLTFIEFLKWSANLRKENRC